jgi:hypothetical protein
MQEKLGRAIEKEMNSKISSKSQTTNDVMGIVKKELAIFDVKGNLDQYHLVARNQNVFFLDVGDLLPK